MRPFLSSNAQDFIEDSVTGSGIVENTIFLSSNAQDFIEDRWWCRSGRNIGRIPEQ